MPQLNLYHIFYTTASQGSISGAARKLFISQPAVSKAIARLEEEMGTQLFCRTAKGVALTESGDILYHQLETAFQAIRYAERQIQNNEALGAGSLSIGVSTTLCKYVLLPYLQKFIQNNPNIKVSISCQSTYETLAALENGSLDIGLVGETQRPGNLLFQPLRTISDVFVATQDYLNQLAQKTVQGNSSHDLSCFSEKELFSNATLLLLHKNNITRQYVEQYMILRDITLDRQIEVSTMDLLIDFAKIGLGIACVIHEFVEKELENGSLVLFPAKEPIPPRRIGFAYGKNRQLTVAAQKFLQEASIPLSP